MTGSLFVVFFSAPTPLENGWIMVSEPAALTCKQKIYPAYGKKKRQEVTKRKRSTVHANSATALPPQLPIRIVSTLCLIGRKGGAIHVDCLLHLQKQPCIP